MWECECVSVCVGGGMCGNVSVCVCVCGRGMCGNVSVCVCVCGRGMWVGETERVFVCGECECECVFVGGEHVDVCH